MSENKNLTSISKYISLILRHKPEEIGITLDEHGWAVKIVKKGCEIAAPVLAMVFLSDTARDTLNKLRYIGNVGYDDAVKAILDSSMVSCCKQEAISLVKMDASSEYYKAVINTVQSSMVASYKIGVIRDMNCKLEEKEEGSQA